MSLLKSTNNRYGGTYVAPEDLPVELVELSVRLSESIEHWREQGIKVVWVKLNSSQSEFLFEFYQAGFENHHCDPDAIMLTKRLEDEAIIPPYANHTIGIGGLVINDKNELLTIRELAHVKKYPNNWKFPGGMLDPFENFEEGVKREVLEETGVNTEFDSFIGFRHHHIGQFKTSNIYAVCRLKPTSHEITIQESEIFDARWFPIADYMSDEKISRYNKAILKNALDFPGLKSIKLPGYMDSDHEYEIFIS